MSRDLIKNIIADPSGLSSKELYTALWHSVQFNWVDEVAMLLKLPQVANLAASRNNACIHKAVLNENCLIAKMLLEIDAVVDGIAADIRPLITARINLDQNMIDLLLSKDKIAAHPNVKEIINLDI